MTLHQIMRKAYRWKPGRTFAQTLAAGLVAAGVGLIEADWPGLLSVAGMALAVAFLQAWADGSDQFATDDKDAV